MPIPDPFEAEYTSFVAVERDAGGAITPEGGWQPNYAQVAGLGAVPVAIVWEHVDDSQAAQWSEGRPVPRVLGRVFGGGAYYFDLGHRFRWTDPAGNTRHLHVRGMLNNPEDPTAWVAAVELRAEPIPVVVPVATADTSTSDVGAGFGGDDTYGFGDGGFGD